MAATMRGEPWSQGPPNATKAPRLVPGGAKHGLAGSGQANRSLTFAARKNQSPPANGTLLDSGGGFLHQFPDAVYVGLSGSGVSDGHPHGVLAPENGA